MDNELLKILSDELRETRNLVMETRRVADAAEKKTDACWAQVDQLRELVIITRNQVNEELAYLKLPWWKKLFGQIT